MEFSITCGVQLTRTEMNWIRLFRNAVIRRYLSVSLRNELKANKSNPRESLPINLDVIQPRRGKLCLV